MVGLNDNPIKKIVILMMLFAKFEIHREGREMCYMHIIIIMMELTGKHRVSIPDG